MFAILVTMIELVEAMQIAAMAIVRSTSIATVSASETGSEWRDNGNGYSDYALRTVPATSDRLAINRLRG